MVNGNGPLNRKCRRVVFVDGSSHVTQTVSLRELPNTQLSGEQAVRKLTVCVTNSEMQCLNLNTASLLLLEPPPGLVAHWPRAWPTKAPGSAWPTLIKERSTWRLTT